MAEATLTRKDFRRAVAVEMGMPFFRRFPAGESSVGASSTTTKIIDTALNQPSGFWNGHWFYHVTSGAVALIRSYNAADHSYILETPLGTTPTTGDKYEIHSVWNAVDIHDAVNQALEDGAKIWHETVTDLTQVFCEDKMQYDLTGFTKKPYIITQVWGEKPSILIRGAVASGAVGSLTIAEDASTLTGVGNGYLVSIYAGTGANQVRTISTVVGQQVNPSVNWTTAPDSTSKYAIWNPNKQRYDWERLDIFYVDNKEYPDTLNLRTRLPYYYGMRMRIQYMSVPTSLTADTDTTVVPKKYILPKSVGILHGRKMKDNKVDRDMHFSEFQRNDKMAEDFLVKNMPQKPGVYIPANESSTFMDFEDPLGWRSDYP